MMKHLISAFEKISLTRLNGTEFVGDLIVKIDKLKYDNNDVLDENIIKEIFNKDFNKETLITICSYINDLLENKIDELENKISGYTINEGNEGNEG